MVPSLVMNNTHQNVSAHPSSGANSKSTETCSTPSTADVPTPLSSRMAELTDRVPEKSRLRMHSLLSATTSSISQFAAKLDVPAELSGPSNAARLSSMKSSAVAGWKGMWAKPVASEPPFPTSQAPLATQQPHSPRPLLPEHAPQPPSPTLSDSSPADELQQETARSDTLLTPAPVVVLSQPSPPCSPASDSGEPLATHLPLIHLDDKTLSDIMKKDSVDKTNPSASSADTGGASEDSKVLPDTEETQHDGDDDVSIPPQRSS